MDKLEHDPRTRQQIKDALYSFIYKPVEDSFKKRLNSIIFRNSSICVFSHNHFMYKGVLYNAENTHPPVRKNRLCNQLKPVMDEYLTELNELNNNELPYVLGFINQVLNSSCDLQDYLRVLPSAIHSPLNSLIATCPCKASRLSETKVETLVNKNKEIITLIKKRLVLNLIG